MKRFVCYAVSRGKVVGIFDSWATCAASVQAYGPAARYRGFYSRLDAERWLLDERAKLEEAEQMIVSEIETLRREKPFREIAWKKELISRVEEFYKGWETEYENYSDCTNCAEKKIHVCK